MAEWPPSRTAANMTATSKPRILTLSTVYPSPIESELGVFVQSRVRYLARRTEIKVLAPVPIINYRRHILQFRRNFPERSYDELIEVIRPRWFYPPGGGALNAAFLFLRIVWSVARLSRKYRFQVIDAHFAHPEGVAAALLSWIFHCPFTVTMRGNEQVHTQHTFRRLTIGWALRRAERVIAVAENLRNLAINLGVDASHVITIPNGIDTEIFHPHDRRQSRAKCCVLSGAKLIVSAGHLIELKGHHRIINALRTLIDSGIDVELAIAGGRGRAEDYEPALRQQISEHKLETRVRMLGHLDREALANLLSAADVFCLASSREGWPNVVHEALACGTPVVATRVGGVPQMIPSQQYGIVVPVDDEIALTNALSRALFTPWDRHLIASWGQTRSWEQVAAEILSIFEEVRAEFDRYRGAYPLLKRRKSPA